MSKFIQNARTASIVFGSAAFVALVSAVVPASAQGVPAGLLRLDSSTAIENSNAQLTDLQQPKVRSTYAHVKKHHVSAQ
jgi:hypothetical protein